LNFCVLRLSHPILPKRVSDEAKPAVFIEQLPHPSQDTRDKDVLQSGCWSFRWFGSCRALTTWPPFRLRPLENGFGTTALLGNFGNPIGPHCRADQSRTVTLSKAWKAKGLKEKWKLFILISGQNNRK
jgi:hypothetical protein